MATQQIPRIEVEQREKIGTRPTAHLRQSGRLPAVIYGHKQEPVHVSTDTKQLLDLLHRNVHVLEVVCGSDTESCLIKQVQWDHLGTGILHMDLARVDLNERVTVSVEVELVGEAIGLKEAHAFLEQNLTALEIECLASAIPEVIKVDVSSLESHTSLTLANVELPNGVQCPLDPETVIASVHIAAAASDSEEVEEVEAPETEAQPELIGKKAEAEQSEGA